MSTITFYIKSDKGFEITLYSGCSDKKDRIITGEIESHGDYDLYKYIIPDGTEFCTAKSAKEGYCADKITFPVEDGKTEYISKHEKLSGEGFECKSRRYFTEQFYDNVLAPDPEWKERYPEVYQTPKLVNPNKPNISFTTQEEMEAFLGKAVAENKNAYLYSLGKTKSERAFDIPLLILTKSDLSHCGSIEDTKNTILSNGKLNVFCRAQIHGDEVASGDGILALLNYINANKGYDYLEKMNLFIIPRGNPEGAFVHDRKNPVYGIDMNRDCINERSFELQVQNKLFYDFMPELYIDTHEYGKNFKAPVLEYSEVMFGIGGLLANSSGFKSVQLNGLKQMIERLSAEGISHSFYSSYGKTNAVPEEIYTMVNPVNISTARGFYSLFGTHIYLIETQGRLIGNTALEKRTVSQFICTKALLDYAFESFEEIKASVDAERQKLISNGKVFDNNNSISLLTGSDYEMNFETESFIYDFATGERKNTESAKKNYYYNKAIKSRAMPTAYAVSNESFEAIKDIIEKHPIKYIDIPSGAKLKLKQYSGTKEYDEASKLEFIKNAVLSEEKEIVFENGGKLFPLAQISSLLLCYLFEPDISDSAEHKVSFVQKELLKPEDVYRCESELSF